MTDTINAREAKRLAGLLHKANSQMWDAARNGEPMYARQHTLSASKLIGEVIGFLMDMPGQTDYYGNPTCRDEIAQRESEITL